VRAFTSLVALLVLVMAAPPQAQDVTPAAPLVLVSRAGRRPVPTTLREGRELVALDDVASLFQVSVRDDTLAGGVTVSYRGRTIVASSDRQMVSVEGRVVTLPSPVLRVGTRWLVPIEFLSSALASIYDQRIDVRRSSRLIVVGDLRLPRVSASIESTGPQTHAAITIAPAATVTVTTEPGRLLLRVDADALDLALPALGGGFIEGIRPGDQPNVVTIGLTAAAGAGRAAVTTANNVTRVLIDVPPAAAVDAGTPSPAPRAATPEPRTPGPGPPGAGLEARGPEASAFLPRPSRAWQTVAIDPGHGGDDPGVRGARGLEEKALTLDVARRLRMMVETRLGLRVILTRDDDRRVSLDQRSAVANNGKADLLVSVHANGSPAPGPSGAEVFHFQLDEQSAIALRAAAVSGVTLPALGGGTRHLDLIPWDLAQATHVNDSAILAGVFREELQRQVPMSQRPLRQAPIRLLAGANMPAVLVEVGYLTNADQEARLGTDEFKTTIAQAIFSAIVRFRAWSEESRTP